MNYEELKAKAHSLPLEPGVYVMRDKSNAVIYVGKAKKLRNRVSQYFQDTVSHTPKTRLMVSHIHTFDVIVAANEFDALVLECSLIKRHMPKYNILLKDDKGYPFLRLDMNEPYPRITLVSRAGNDGAGYYGPYGSRGVTNSILQSVRQSLKLPDCSRVFPRDIGKDRPCLNYHMDLCAGWCQTCRTQEEYRERMEQARQILLGNYRSVADQLRGQMLNAAESLDFELAAALRDRLNSVVALGQKQLVTAGISADIDVIGYGATETKACFAVLHYRGGDLLDKDYQVFALPDDPAEAVSTLLIQYYLSRGAVPKFILLPFPLEDMDLLGQLMQQEFSRNVRLSVPERGEKAHLVALAGKNAYEEAERLTDQEERNSAALTLLGKMLSINPPQRIESFDISNISGTDIVASMVVFQDGKTRKSDYKRFKIEGLADQDDYASMQQVLQRRFQRYLSGDAGFDRLADLLLIDGGITHARTALAVLSAHNIQIPVFGMVKDDRHRTRALVTPDGEEIAVDSKQAVFALIGRIQEETHRFAITYHRKLRSKRLRYSELDGIAGIGPKRKQELLKAFKSITAIAAADLQQLEHYLPKDAAAAVYHHFQRKGDQQE